MPIVQYKCSKCKMVRNSYKEAKKCEQSHLPAISMRDVEYRVGAYPFRVIITFSDGEEREYIKQD